MNYENPKNESEILSADEQKLREMCRALKPVEAPKDFDFQLKARLANAKSSDFQPRFGWAFRYALPALALMLAVGLLAYSGAFLSSGNNPIVARGNEALPDPPPANNALAGVAPIEQNPANFETVVPPAANQSAANQPAPKAPAREIAFRETKNAPTDVKHTPKKGNFSSAEQSVGPPPVITPKNFEPKAVPQNLPNDEKSNPLSVKEVLSIMGIDADLENGKWTVKSVRANGVGESSGVKENDIIEAIDDQPLAGETVFSRTIKGANLIVTRRGEKSQIKLRNKQ